MNYRHAFHAGNFADVFKHSVLARLVEYLKRKDAAFRVIDTHAGIGRYDLQASEAARTGEWREGIARLLDAPLPAEAAALVAPYLGTVRQLNSGGALRYYPGSPLVTRALLRRQDRLSAVELHPADVEVLRRSFAGDHQSRIIHLDGWLALGAHLPPKEKRGLVLVDPPFEQPGEFERMLEGLVQAHRRWPNGIYAFWYPIKDGRAVEAYRTALAGCGIPKILDTWLTVRPATAEPRLIGNGMVIVNPPFTLAGELDIMLPALVAALAAPEGGGCGHRMLAGETQPG
jgi:23S rRNA (adenine2030-N6)-methyltransferase